MALDPPLPEVALIGRSNVGKSSLLNALVGRRIAKTSGTPGKTRALNVFLIGGAYYFLDLPGYGYARAGKAQRAAFRGLLKHALLRQRLRGVVWLLDIRHPPSTDDRAMQDVLVEGETHVLAALRIPCHPATVRSAATTSSCGSAPARSRSRSCRSTSS